MELVLCLFTKVLLLIFFKLAMKKVVARFQILLLIFVCIFFQYGINS